MTMTPLARDAMANDNVLSALNSAISRLKGALRETTELRDELKALDPAAITAEQIGRNLHYSTLRMAESVNLDLRSITGDLMTAISASSRYNATN